jgi:hypothetical protein
MPSHASSETYFRKFGYVERHKRPLSVQEGSGRLTTVLENLLRLQRNWRLSSLTAVTLENAIICVRFMLELENIKLLLKPV